LEGLKKIDKTEKKIKVHYINNGTKIDGGGWAHINGIKTKNGEQNGKKLQIRLQGFEIMHIR
jgi:hypothetical protein